MCIKSVFPAFSVPDVKMNTDTPNPSMPLSKMLEFSLLLDLP
jgi:hypothetical protein